jgi:BFD-like [2Fe-2S] binding domain
VCGVGGAALALVEGELAGSHAAGGPVDAAVVTRLRRRRDRLRAFAAAMHRAHPVPAGWTGWADDATTLCRCEEVPVGAVRAAVRELGATDPRAVKLLARPGMGLCQGRVCGHATAALVAQECGRAVIETDLLGIATRPIAQPVTLASVAAGTTDPVTTGPDDTPEEP